MRGRVKRSASIHPLRCSANVLHRPVESAADSGLSTLKARRSRRRSPLGQPVKTLAVGVKHRHLCSQFLTQRGALRQALLPKPTQLALLRRRLTATASRPLKQDHPALQSRPSGLGRDSTAHSIRSRRHCSARPLCRSSERGTSDFACVLT